LPPLLDVDDRDPNVPARLTPCRSLSDKPSEHHREVYTRCTTPTTIHITQLNGFCAKHVARVGAHRHSCARFVLRSLFRFAIPAQAGIQGRRDLFLWTPAFAGVTNKKFVCFGRGFFITVNFASNFIQILWRLTFGKCCRHLSGIVP
jgi:hypothetical protein